MKLDDVLDIFDGGYQDPDVVADEVTRKYGLSPAEIIAEKERRANIVSDLEIISRELTENQRHILAMTGAGFTVRQMEEELGLALGTISEQRQGISKKLEKVADEERIQFVAGEVMRLVRTSKGRHSKLYEELCEELDRRVAVRNALKRLFVTLTPPESTKEIGGGTSMSSYPFEGAMQVNKGIREGIEEGRKVMKTVVKCEMPEYMQQVFGDDCTCCTWCATCTRKKDISGRNGYGRYGLEKK